MTKRDKLEVIHDILKVISEKDGKIRPTHILYKANLSHQMLDEYIKELTLKEFLIELPLNKGKTYKLTTKGFNYLNQYKLIKEFTNSFGLD